MTRSIEHALNLRPGELRRGLPLFAYLFLVMASYGTGRVARDSLFLSRFPAVQLPYVDIATALAVGLVIAAYINIGRRCSLRNLLLGSLALFTSNCCLFWTLTRFRPVSWLYPTIYVWVGIFGVLATTQVWALANHVLTTREARRIFGLVAGGAIAGGIFAGFFSKVAAKAFGAESLLLGMAIFLSLCPPLVVIIWRQHQEAAGKDGKRRLWVRPLDSLADQPLVRTEDASAPFWSPDSKWIAFFANGKLMRVTATGGEAQTLCQCESGGGGGTWNQDNVILFSPAVAVCRECYRAVTRTFGGLDSFGDVDFAVGHSDDPFTVVSV